MGEGARHRLELLGCDARLTADDRFSLLYRPGVPEPERVVDAAAERQFGQVVGRGAILRQRPREPIGPLRGQLEGAEVFGFLEVTGLSRLVAVSALFLILVGHR